MPEYIGEDGTFTDDFRAELPDRLGDAYYNDPETKLQPTKELDNVKNIFDMAKMVVTGSRKISQHGETLKKATEGMIKIPGEGATPEEIVAYRQAQGVPETPDGYELVNDQLEPEDKPFAEIVQNSCHKNGIPKSKAQAVFNDVKETLNQMKEADVKKGMDLLNADVQALKDAKKEKYDAFIADTNKVAAHFDIKGESGAQDNPIGSNFMKLMDTMGIKDTPVVREFLGAIAPLVLEGGTHLGAGASPESAKWFTDYEYDETGKAK